MELLWYDIRTLDTDTMAHTVGMMDEERRRRVNDIAGEDDRRRTVAGELLARRLLAQRLGCGEGEVPLRWDEMGKPAVDAAGVYVSVSHSGPYAVCAIADVPVGVDVEVVRSADEKFIRGGDGLHPRGRRRRLRPFLGDLDRQGGPVQADGQGPPAGSQPPGPAPGRGAGSRHAEGLRPDHGPASWLNFLQFAKKGFSPAPEFVII